MTDPNPTRKGALDNMADVFSEPSATTPESYIEKYVGEGKKYASVEDLAKAYANADTHISELKTDLQSTREFIAEKLDEIAKQREAQPPVQNVEPRTQNPVPAAPPNDAGEDLDTRIAKALELRDNQKRLQENANIVQDVLVERLGSVEKAAEAVISKAKELGLHPSDMKELAAKSPKAFLTTMGVDPDVKPVSSSTPAPRSDVRPDMVNPGAPKPRTYRFHEDVRKSNPSLYNSISYQQKLMKDAMELGDEFFN
jgi:hypothetical protein